MTYALIILILVVLAVCIIILAKRLFNKDVRAQRALNKYVRRNFSTEEIGKFYERYIGHLYETEGHDVVYHGALNGYADLGRDLIVKCVDETLIVQTKCWSKNKLIQEKHIFQLFGTMTHFKLTSEKTGCPTKAVFYTTAKYSNIAKDAARVLGVELRTEELNRSYPMIKCSVSTFGEKFYYLPFDSDYDKIKIDLNRNEYFVKTVKEAVGKGFRRA
ncbi:restriction endonuclease [Bdellovibrio bacteriovorus]|uniref:restriction endonuclease n=1 Tax=Bdellovibrio bacteriovorus TaxID=959 RepID=UPI0035A93168